MAGIGDLVAHLGIDNSGFKKGLSSSRSMLSAFAGGVAGLISPIGAAFAGLAGTAGIGLLVKSSFEGVDALAKFGQKLGLTADQAAGFKHAAELSGVSTDALQAALQRANREGLDIFQIADNIAAIQDPAERSKYAFETLGKSGADLIPLLMGGSEALRGMVDEGAKLSGLKGLDASKVEEANDAISRARAAFEGIGNIISVTLAPAVEWAAIKMQDLALWIQSGSGYLQTLGEVGAQAFDIVAEGAFTSFATIEYGLAHSGDTAKLFWAEFQLAAVVAFNELHYLFTVQIPTVVSFMVDNASRLLVDGFGSAVEMLADNMRNGFGEIADFITSWGEDPIEFNWKPVGDGFAKVLEDMPEIAERPISDLERQLAEDADRLGKSFGEGLQAHIDTKRAGLADHLSAKPGAGLTPREPSEKALKTPDLKAAFQGSQEAARIMLGGVGGGKDQIPEKHLGVSQQILIATKENKPPALMPITLGT